MINRGDARLDAIFRALSDSTRRSILRGLTQKEKTVGQIARPYAMSLAAISKHLRILAEADFITREKRGSFQIVRLNPRPFKKAEEWLAFYERFWSQRLDDLQNLLEGKEHV